MIKRTVLMAYLLAASANAEISWETDRYDAGPKFTPDIPPADLLLPMPCGGAMAFEQIDVFVDGDSRISDKALRHGDSSTEYGYRNFLRQERLRGPFSGEDSGHTYFYMARYELTQLQYAALTDETCGFSTNFIMTLPQTELSWFAAHELGLIYTEWLRENAPNALPLVNGETGAYLRLPTEVEWEFAARGGEAVDALAYLELRPPMDDQLTVFAQYDGDATGPVGIKKPNPLNLFDMFGNVEEIMFEPFRLNGLGSFQGHIGGMITRGGSYLSSEVELTSASRFERSFYNVRSGRAQAPETVGMRLVIGAPAIGQFDVEELDKDWRTQLEGDSTADQSPISVLNKMISESLDPTQTAALEGLLIDLAAAEQTARDESAKRIKALLKLATTTLTVIDWQERRLGNAVRWIEDRTASLEAATATRDNQEIELSAFEREELRLHIEALLGGIADLQARKAEFETSITNQIDAYTTGLGLLLDADLVQLEQVYDNYVSGLELSGDTDVLETAKRLRRHFDAFRQSNDQSRQVVRRLILEE